MEIVQRHAHVAAHAGQQSVGKQRAVQTARPQRQAVVASLAMRLADGQETLGVLGEPALCEGQREITAYGGWRAYLAARGTRAR